jgi:signal transduction histidine kinase
MDRRLLVQVSAPALAIGLLLFGACLTSAWYIHRQHTDLARVLSEHTASRAAPEGLSEESARVSGQVDVVLIALGLLGPVSGLMLGYGVARGLSRSIGRISVRVKDVAHRLEHDVASVSLEPGGDLRGLDRQLEHVLHRVEQVTERQQQHERELLRAERLAAVGQLAASVADEVRNPLTGVKLLVEGALRSGDGKPLSLDDLRVIHREIARVEQTMRGFLDFARPPAPHPDAATFGERLTSSTR